MIALSLLYLLVGYLIAMISWAGKDLRSPEVLFIWLLWPLYLVILVLTGLFRVLERLGEW